MKILLVLLIIASVHARVGQRSLQQACDPDTHEQALFTLVADDEASYENGWSLVCDNIPVWNRPVGTLDVRDGDFVSDTACLPVDATCELTLYDQGGNGLRAQGWYYLKLGARTVAVSSQEAGSAFAKRTYCFGPECPEEPLENDESGEEGVITDDGLGGVMDVSSSLGGAPLECIYGLQEMALFTFVTDDFPEENGWSLVCGGKTVFERPVGSIVEEAGTFVTDKACVAKDQTCELTVYDADGDGLVGDNGGYYLKYGATTIAVSSLEQEPAFSERVYCFGPECTQPPVEDGTDDNVEITDDGLDGVLDYGQDTWGYYDDYYYDNVNPSAPEEPNTIGATLDEEIDILNEGNFPGNDFTPEAPQVEENRTAADNQRPNTKAIVIPILAGVSAVVLLISLIVRRRRNQDKA